MSNQKLSVIGNLYRNPEQYVTGWREMTPVSSTDQHMFANLETKNGNQSNPPKAESTIGDNLAAAK